LKYSTHWRLLFRVKNEAKALGRLTAAGKRLGQPITPKSVERYWKIPELYDCHFELALSAKTPEAAIAEVLLLAHGLGNGWYVLGPSLNGQCLTVFDGVFGVDSAGTPYVAGLDWGSFSVMTGER
jgi:hypothetical protein